MIIKNQFIKWLNSPEVFDVWEPWFAWRPIFIDDSLLWLENIERIKRTTAFPITHNWYEYRIKSSS